MIASRQLVGLLCLVGAAACASSSRPAETGPARWTGNFRQTGQNSAMLTPSTTVAQASAYGNITLTPEEATPARTRVDLSLNIPSAAGNQVAWAVMSGPCGSAGPPVTGPNEFPVISMSSSGSGAVGVTLPFGLDEHGTYHANVFKSSRVSSDEGDVLMCANLSRSR